MLSDNTLNYPFPNVSADYRRYISASARQYRGCLLARSGWCMALRIRWLVVGLLLLPGFGCSWRQAPAAVLIPEPPPFHWLLGCWRSEDGTIEERWAPSMGGAHWFGFSVTRKDGKSLFFEQLRIDLQGTSALLHAYPKGIGPTSFTAQVETTPSVKFVNGNNDYPQSIHYWREGERLRAAIAQLDGSKAIEFTYNRCPAEQ